MDDKHILISDIGKVIELTPDKMEVVGSVPAGQVLVDGLGVGDVGSIVLRDRKHLAEDGLIVVVATIDPPPARWWPGRTLFPAVLCTCGNPKA